MRRAIRAKDRKVLAAIYKSLCRSEVAISPAVACLLRLRALALTTVRALALGRLRRCAVERRPSHVVCVSLSLLSHIVFYNPPSLGGVCWMVGVLRIRATVD